MLELQQGQMLLAICNSVLLPKADRHARTQVIGLVGRFYVGFEVYAQSIIPHFRSKRK